MPIKQRSASSYQRLNTSLASPETSSRESHGPSIIASQSGIKLPPLLKREPQVNKDRPLTFWTPAYDAYMWLDRLVGDVINNENQQPMLAWRKEQTAFIAREVISWQRNTIPSQKGMKADQANLQQRVDELKEQLSVEFKAFNRALVTNALDVELSSMTSSDEQENAADDKLADDLADYHFPAF